MSEDITTPPKGYKTFSLKKQETEKLRLLRQHLEAIYSIEVSTIAADRLAYNVTPNTQFHLSPDMTSLRIFERPTAINEQVPPADSGGIVAA
jgi:hypothetical protein